MYCTAPSNLWGIGIPYPEHYTKMHSSFTMGKILRSIFWYSENCNIFRPTAVNIISQFIITNLEERIAHSASLTPFLIFKVDLTFYMKNTWCTDSLKTFMLFVDSTKMNRFPNKTETTIHCLRDQISSFGIPLGNFRRKRNFRIPIVPVL